VKPLTTTISEVNRLYGIYYDETSANNAYAAHRAWVAYTQYLREYNRERGLQPRYVGHGTSLSSESKKGENPTKGR